MPRGGAASTAASLLLSAAFASPAAAGRITYEVQPPQDPRLQAVASVFRHERLPRITRVIGDAVKLPRDLAVVATECGQVNASYQAKRHRIVLCYELAGFFGVMFENKPNVDRTLWPDYALNAMTFVLLHELGHAVIGELDLGVTGGEEDAVDDFAALLLLGDKQTGLAIDAAETMLDMGALGQGQLAFSDEHSFSQQRFYNVLCLIHGSDPPGTRVLIDRGLLPAARAARCADEFRRKRKGWDVMVAPYRRR
jgi:hypothetical protein